MRQTRKRRSKGGGGNVPEKTDDFVMKQIQENLQYRTLTDLRLMKLENNLKSVIQYLEKQNPDFKHTAVLFGGKRRKTRKN